jgi:hypothetical protein
MMSEVRGETNKELNPDKPQTSGSNIGSGDQGRLSKSPPVEPPVTEEDKAKNPKPLPGNKQPDLLKPEQQPKRRS